ncbi:MAG TPA: MFS transporter [Solirubrobacteraceae bacterium]|nr:MFS transporter [Solirubrobacteraceae bacterium]
MDSTARRWTLLATSLGFAVIQLDVSVVNVAIKPIGAALGGGVSALQWVVSAYTLAFASLILTAGALGDRIGAKRVFIGGFVLFTIASAACGLAPRLPVLIAARAVQGVGAAVLASSSLSLLNHTFPDPGDRARAVGFWAAGASIALAGGPLVGGVLIATLSWRAIFFLNAPIGLVGILLTLRFAPETTRTSARGIDLPGQALGILALGSLAAATIQGGHSGFGSPAVLAGFALAAGFMIAFVAVEARRADPMLPLGFFHHRAFSAATAIGLLINVAFYGLIFVFSLYFQRAQHLSPLQTGLAFAPSTVAVLIANLLAGRADARFGARRVIIAGSVLMTAALAGLLGAEASTPYAGLVAQLMVLGFGIGLVVPAITAMLLASVDRSRSGIASGTLNSARQSGSVIGVALFGALIAGGNGLTAGLHVALAISVALTLIVTTISLTIGSPERSQPRGVR